MEIKSQEKVQTILQKSPLTITKEEYQNVSEIILEYKLNNFVMVLLRMQEFYLYFDIPLSIKHNIDLLSYLDEDKINFFELIGYTYFNKGSYLKFYENLVLFKFKQITRLSQSKLLLLHKVIGEIIASVWWHYEFFKQSTNKFYKQKYLDMVKIIQSQQQGEDQQIFLNQFSKFSKYFKLIISNSLSYNLNENQLSSNCNDFIKSLLKRDELNFQDIQNYIQQSQAFSLKKRLIYHKLLFYYWLISKQQQLSNEPNKKNKAIMSQTVIRNRNSQSLNTSKIAVNQFQSGILSSSTFGSKIQSQISNSSIRFKNSSNQIIQYLEENVIFLEETLQDSDLQMQFEVYDQHYDNIIKGLEIFEINDWEDLKIISGQSTQKIKQILETINIEKLIQAYHDKYFCLKSYSLVIDSTQEFKSHIEYIDDEAEKMKYYQFPTPTSQFYRFYEFVTDKSQTQQIEIIRLLGLRLQFTKSQVNTFCRCLQLQVEDHFIVTEAAIRLKSIKSIQNCLQNRDWLSQIDQNYWLLLKKIVFQQTLIDIFYLIVQCCFEQQIHLNLWQTILKHLFQILDVGKTNDILLNFFQYQISYGGNFQEFLNLISVSEPPTFNTTQFQDVLKFLENVLSLNNQDQKVYILKGFQIVYPFPQIFYIDFIIKNIKQNHKSLISYIQIKNNKDNPQFLSEVCFTLHESDQEFYSKFIPPEDTPGLDLQLSVEKELSQKQAFLMCQKIIQELNLPQKESVINDISKYLSPLKNNCQSLIKELDEMMFNNQINEVSNQQILEYILNQTKFIEKYVDRRVDQTKLKIQNKHKQIKLLVDKFRQSLLIVNQMNKKIKLPQRSKQYFKKEYLDMIEPEVMINQFMFEILIFQRNILGINLIQSDYLDIFTISRAANEGEKKSNGSQIAQQKQSKSVEEIIQFYQQIKEMEKIPILKIFLDQLEIEMNKCLLELQEYQQSLVIVDLNAQIEGYRKIQIGCYELCPICGRKCDQDVNKKHKHKCSTGHQIRSMKGILVDNKLSLLTCEEFQDDDFIYDYEEQDIRKWKDLKLKYKNWNFSNLKNSDDLRNHQLKYQKYWNNKVGKIICNYLNCSYFKKEIDQNNYLHHFILVIDESGSMAGEKWKLMIEAIQLCFIELRKCPNNRISVIQFSDDARFVFGLDQPEQIPAQDQLIQFKMMSGGTNFENAFLLTYYAIKSQIGQFSLQTILFYTDGDADFPKISMDLFSQIDKELRQKIDILICSELQESKSLQKVCSIFQQKMGKGTIKESVSINQFGKILQDKVCQKY